MVLFDCPYCNYRHTFQVFQITDCPARITDETSDAALKEALARLEQNQKRKTSEEAMDEALVIYEQALKNLAKS